MKSSDISLPLCVLLAGLPLADCFAQSFVGTNAPGTGTNFTFTVNAGATNLSLVISNSATTYSYLLLKNGGAPTDTVFDFAARLNGQTNEINLEAPEFALGTYGLRVSTPLASVTHAFQVVLTTNRADLRSAGYPVSKPLVFSTTGSLTNAGAGAWNYFQVDVPSNLLTGWRIVLSSTNATTPGLYIKRGQLPNSGVYDKAVAPGQPIDTIIFTSAEATNSTYFIGVYQASGAAGSASYTLSTELASITTLNWDPGTTDAGTEVFTNQSGTGGDYFFAITTQGTADLVWRTALNVFSNQANLYMSYGSLPSTTSYTYASTRVGSNGFVLAQGPQFTAGQNWYILVHATPGAQWNLVTGEAYVQQLPPLAADSSSGATVTMGAEGMHFFKTTISANTLAWRLWLSGLSNQLYVKQSAAPVPYNTSTYDLTQPGQMLVVPTYLNVGSQYFVGVAGNPGLNFTLDSRQHAVTNLTFNSTTNITVTGYGYTTFLVQVPVQQIAWQVSVAPISGNANVAVRRDNVPNEFVNDAFSEPPAGVGASVTLVPPTLSNGSFYLTVYGTGPYTVTLFNGQPAITPVDYVFSITNDEPNQVGWRYFTVTNTADQLGTLGWEIDLSNAPPGTEIALRRNTVPGAWNYRNNPYDYTGFSTLGYVDLSSTLGFLQQPNHPADVWYIGVYSPTAALGNFVLNGIQLTGPPVNFDGAGSTLSVTNQPVGKYQYFTFTVPPDAMGWDLRLTNVTSGNPQLYICRDQPPPGNGYGWNPSASSSWPSGYNWTVGNDWTSDYYNPGNVVSYGQVFAVGMGNPLLPGTYYVGVYNYSGSTPMSYTVLSRGIGASYSIPVTPIAFSNGVVSVPSLAPRQADYYSLAVPTNEPSWKVRLTDVSGESLMLIQKDALPNSQANNGAAYSLSGGRVMEKPGSEQYLLLPTSGSSNIAAGNYYLAVVSQGVNPTGNTIGTNVSGYTLTSFGPEGITNLGTVGVVDLLQTNAIQGGENILDQFSVPPGTLAVEARLDNVTGAPIMSLRTGTNVVVPYFGYGYDGGVGASWNSSTLITLPNPTATNYSLTVQAGNQGSFYPDADFTVHVRQMPTPPLPFDSGIAASSVALNFVSEQYLPGGAGFVLDMGVTPGVTNTLQASTNLINWTTLATFVSPSNSWIYTDLNASQYPQRFYRLEAQAIGVSGVLQDGQSAFYTVNVPATFDGQPVIGWKLDVTTISGTASIRVSPGAVPGSGGCADSPFVTSEGIYVAPYLTPGVWYVEVRGSGTTGYMLVSHNLQLARPAWTMPAVGASVTTTGLPPAGPLFADTGVDTNGIPLQGLEGDQGTDLAKGAFDYYAIIVPTNNTGVLRTRLDAISGNPNLYIRVGTPSTLSHDVSGSCGNSLYDRSLGANAGSEYGNWVPLNGRFETALTNGTWYLAVQAAGNSNVRYRLRLDTGSITNLALNNGSATNQQMVAGDWLYYAIQIPTNAPVNWNVSFSVQLGSVVMYVRDRVPPGQATSTTDYQGWSRSLD